MKLYQARMEIEEGFLDSENRCGLGVAQANRIGQQRRANLLLIAKQVRVRSSSKRDPYSVIFPAHLLLRQSVFRLLPNQIRQSLTTINHLFGI